ELAESLGEVAHLPRVHDSNIEAGCAYCRRQRMLETTGGLDDHERCGELSKPINYASNAGVAVRLGPAVLWCRKSTTVELLLRHIDSNEHSIRHHASSGEEESPSLAKCGLGGHATVRAYPFQKNDVATQAAPRASLPI